MFWIGDTDTILIQSSSILGRKEDNLIYLIIFDTSKRERMKERWIQWT
jgi:hypothetical protein